MNPRCRCQPGTLGTSSFFTTGREVNCRDMEETMDFEGYCVKCRAKKQIKDGTVRKTPQGRPMAQGICPTCGTKVTRFLSTKENK